MDTDLKKFKIKAIAIASVVIALSVTWATSDHLLKKQCIEQRGNWLRGVCAFDGKAGE